jgi:PAS domain S-box-containing protein
VLYAPGHTDAEGGVAASAGRGTLLPLAVAALSALALMTLFEFLKVRLDPRMTAGQSNAATIAFGGILATAFAFIARRDSLKGRGEIERERDMFRTVIDGIPEGIFVKDMAGRYLLVNRRFVEYKGVKSGAELLGKMVFDFLPGDLAVAITAEDQELRSGKRSMVEREVSAVDGEGNVKWDITTRVPLTGKGGKVVGTAGLQRDITRSKHMEQRLREQEARLLTAQKIGKLGGFEVDLVDGVDLEQCPMRCSGELFRIAGFKPSDGDLPGTGTNIFRMVTPEDRDRIKQAMAAAIRDAKPHVLDFRITCSDGTQRTVQGAADVVSDPQTGKPTKLQGTILDITDRMRAEEQLEEANANLAQRVTELQRRSKELHLLSEMAGWLQSCNAIDEAYLAIASSVEALFPEWMGGAVRDRRVQECGRSGCRMGTARLRRACVRP